MSFSIATTPRSGRAAGGVLHGVWAGGGRRERVLRLLGEVHGGDPRPNEPGVRGNDGVSVADMGESSAYGLSAGVLPARRGDPSESDEGVCERPGGGGSGRVPP